MGRLGASRLHKDRNPSKTSRRISSWSSELARAIKTVAPSPPAKTERAKTALRRCLRGRSTSHAVSNIVTLSPPYRVSADRSGVPSEEFPFRNHRSMIGSMASLGGLFISAIASSVDRATDSSADWIARIKIDRAASLPISVRSLTEIFQLKRMKI